MGVKGADERRRFPGIPLRPEAWVVEPDGSRRHLRTRDLSKGGICLEVEGKPYHHGQLCDVRLRLCDEEQEIALSG